MKKDDRHCQTHFLNHVAKSKDSSVSAPGLRAPTSHPVIARPIRDPATGAVAVVPGNNVKDAKSKNAWARANEKHALGDARAVSQVQPRGGQQRDS